MRATTPRCRWTEFDLDGDGEFDEPLPLDIDGAPRLVGIQVDMGADEFFDSDGDGLPDWWELLYFDSATDAEATADDDGDGRSNLTEYEGDTDPWRAPLTLYVDPSGNDSWDGLTPVWDGQHGPKANDPRCD